MNISDTLQRFTTYNVIAAIAVFVFRSKLDIRIVDIVRATSWLVAVSVLAIHMSSGYDRVLMFYKKHYPYIPQWFVLPYDLLIHLAPALVLGLPRHGYLGWIIGYALILVWYLLVRSKMRALYFEHLPPAAYDKMVLVLLPMSALLLSLRNILRS